jgi:hypothetical protein|tara:strand:- start:459 stop:683 length:225 start_codon:yes stop_codon:yes gene_type:complete
MPNEGMARLDYLAVLLTSFVNKVMENGELGGEMGLLQDRLSLLCSFIVSSAERHLQDLGGVPWLSYFVSMLLFR